MLTAILFVLGLVLLTFGADVLVKGAAKLAAASGVSSLVVGLTVVAMGTSAPELAVSINAGTSGEADIALGNVIGSNIFNILFVLGVSAVIVPLAVQKQIIRIEVPIMIGVSILMIILGLDGVFSRIDGVILLVGIVVYTWTTVARGRRESAMAIELAKELNQEFGPPEPATFRNVARDIVFIVIGLGMLVLGARWLVAGAVECARWLGVGEVIIGLTIVAVGTSLPEVATSIAAAVRGERDLAVGNVVGSNIFNILGVLGAAALASPKGIQVAPELMHFDLPLMLFVALVCLPICYTGRTVSRAEGSFLLAIFVAYTAYLILDQIHSPVATGYHTTLVFIAAPVSALTLTVLAIRDWRTPKPAAPAP